MKYCNKCKLFKELKESNKDKSRKDEISPYCRVCSNFNTKFYYKNNKIKYIKTNKLYRQKHQKEISKQKKEYHQKYPWKRILRGIKQRCNILKCKQYKDYGGRGIKCLIIEDEIKRLWFRDKAYLMKRPSIDRINNDGNYCISNCRFIELSENIAERNKRASSKIVYQYDLQGNFIKKWQGVGVAAKKLKINNSNISSCSLRKIGYKTAGGFIWRYKQC